MVGPLTVQVMSSVNMSLRWVAQGHRQNCAGLASSHVVASSSFQTFQVRLLRAMVAFDARDVCPSSTAAQGFFLFSLS